MKTTVFLLLFFALWGVSNGQPAIQVKLDHLTLEDGLSQSSGHAILQDRYGYMWFGTQNGLNKYDGYDFTVYENSSEDSVSISSSHVTYLYEDSRGALWIGTAGGGISLFNRDKDSFTRYVTDYVDHHLSISDNSVSSIIEDAEGKFWIGTSSGLNLFDRDNEEFIHFYAVDDDPNTLSSSNITSLYLDSRDRLWIGTTRGLNYWEAITGTFRNYKHDPSNPNSLSHNVISTIYEDPEGNLWVGTSGGGLNHFDRDEEEFVRYRHIEDDPYSISGNTILSILEDSRGVLWVGTENEGLNVFDRENEQFFHHRSNVSNPASLTHNSVYSLYESEDNILWIGTFSGGISYMDRKYPKFEHYRHDPFDAKPLSSNSVVSFLETSGGTFLIGTDGGGLNVFDRETNEFSYYTPDPDNPADLSSNVILAIHEDRHGRIWIGYYNGGVTLYKPDDESVKHFRHDPNDPHSLRSDHVFAIHEGREGELWFGTNNGGIHLLDPETGRFELIATASDGANVTRVLYEDTRGSLWAGSYGGGLIEIDKRNGSVIDQFVKGPNGMTSNVVLTIHEDKEENLWVGTVEGGLHLFDRNTKTFTVYSVAEGLPDPAVYGILEDDHGNLWLSTGAGLAVFTPETETFTTYSVEHGVQSNEFNPLAYYKDREGYMYFGGINGFNRFHPDHIAEDAAVPPVVLTDFKIFNQSVEIGEDSPLQKHISRTERIILPYTASVLTFDYVALNFNKKKGDQFAYMLEGFDSGWNYVGSQRSASYTNLNPGEYTFRVKTANIYGIWRDMDQTLAVIITPPFWQTSWFYLLAILFISAALGLVIRWRVSSVTEQKKYLKQEFVRQTSELYKKNAELRNSLAELKKTRSELVDKAHKAGMADLATNVLHNVGNILNSVNVSVAIIDEKLKKSKLQNLKQANQMLKENSDDLENFVLKDPRGQKLLHYYIRLGEPFGREHEELTEQAARLTENMKLMIDVVAAQQSFSNAGRIIENLSLEELVEDTLILQSASIENHSLELIKDYRPVDEVQVEKSKIMHTLLNLFKNAKESMSDLDPGKRKVTLKTFQDDDYVYLSITDSGCGIPKEDLKKIFTHGYTTKSYGHGFGLHSCANYMKELKGEIRVESEGPGKGASVTLCFPRKTGNTKELMTLGVTSELADYELS